MHSGILVLLIAALIFWIARIFLVVFNYFHYSEIKKFYNVALGIEESDLENVTWNDVQHRLMEVQVEQRMCIHKEALSELDIYHRILRFTNYFIAMANKDVIPLKLNLPFLGEVVFLSGGLRYNIDFLLFSGIGAPFKNNWHLKDEYKRSENRHHLANALKKRILYLGIANFVMLPVIFVFQILRSFYHYGAVLKKEPGFLGLRRWSHYGQVVLRHYNELDHELKARLNRGYRCSSQYMNIFTSALTTVIAAHITFICGSIFVVLLLLTIYDEDVIQVEHIITIISVSGFGIYICQVFFPKENLVWCPEVLMTKIFSEVHYLPEEWKSKAHTTYVRKEFGKLFQYKYVHLFESLASPVITPFILCFRLRHKSLEIVDFLRNFTVEVVGVGDICSFAQMSLRKHGSHTWHPNVLDLDSTLDEHEEEHLAHTDHGKTERSLLHFALTNPSWKPPTESEAFLNALRVQARKDFNDLPVLHEENDLQFINVNALHASINTASLGSEMGPGGNNLLNSRWLTNGMGASQNACVGVSHLEGSKLEPSKGVLGSLSPLINNHNFDDHASPRHSNEPMSSFLPPTARPQDMIAMEMSVSTLYLRELHLRNRATANYTDATVNFEGHHQFPNTSPPPCRFSVLRPPTSDAGSYYHSTGPPSVGSSVHPYMLIPTIMDTSTSMEDSASRRYRENTPLLNSRT